MTVQKNPCCHCERPQGAWQSNYFSAPFVRLLPFDKLPSPALGTGSASCSLLAPLNKLTGKYLTISRIAI